MAVATVPCGDDCKSVVHVLWDCPVCNSIYGKNERGVEEAWQV